MLQELFTRAAGAPHCAVTDTPFVVLTCCIGDLKLHSCICFDIIEILKSHLRQPHQIATKSQCQATPNRYRIATKSQCQATPNRARQIATTRSQSACRARRLQCQATIFRGLIYYSALPKILTSTQLQSLIMTIMKIRVS